MHMEASISRPIPTREPAGNTSTGILKFIALFFMLIDHCGARLFPNIPELRMLGRIAFPIYCWCMIVGFHYTRNVPKYLFRILLTGLLCQPLYSIVMGHGWTSARFSAIAEQWSTLRAAHPEFLDFAWTMLKTINSRPNIFLTLFIGLCALWGIREKKLLSHIWAPVLMLIAATALNADYGWKGVMLIILLYAVRDSRPGIAAVMVAFFLYWGTFYGVTAKICGIKLDFASLPLPINAILSPFFRMETYGLLSLPFILIRFRKKWKMPAWLGYGLYPAHLVLLLILEQFIG